MVSFSHSDDDIDRTIEAVAGALPDGTSARSDRPGVALCVCRRSRRPPWCDTSHRRKVRVAEGER